MNKIKLNYERFGNGTPLVCIHGFPLDHSIWLPLIPYLENKFDIILVDLQGYGSSPEIKRDMSLFEFAEGIVNLLDSLSIKKVLLVGHSMGGYVSLIIAQIYPERLSGLVLTASHPYADSPKKKRGRLETIEKLRQNGIEKTLGHMPGKMSRKSDIQKKIRSLMQNTTIQTLIASQKAMAERTDKAGMLKLLDIPVKLILGEKDPYTPQEMRMKLEKDFGSEAIIHLQNSAHMPMMEEPKSISEVLINSITV